MPQPYRKLGRDYTVTGRIFPHYVAPRAPHPAPEEASPPVDVHKAVADANGEAHAQMHALAIDHQRATGKPYAQAYAHVYSHPDNRGLRGKVKSEHIAATMRGDAVYNAHNNPVGRETEGMSTVER